MQGRGRLMGLRFIEVRRFAGPTLIGEAGEMFDLFLADKILFLIFDGWRIGADVAQPLVPMRCTSVSSTFPC